VLGAAVWSRRIEPDRRRSDDVMAGGRTTRLVPRTRLKTTARGDVRPVVGRHSTHTSVLRDVWYGVQAGRRPHQRSSFSLSACTEQHEVTAVVKRRCCCRPSVKHRQHYRSRSIPYWRRSYLISFSAALRPGVVKRSVTVDGFMSELAVQFLHLLSAAKQSYRRR